MCAKCPRLCSGALLCGRGYFLFGRGKFEPAILNFYLAQVEIYGIVTMYFCKSEGASQL